MTRDRKRRPDAQCPLRPGEPCTLCQVDVTGPQDCGLVYLVMHDPELRVGLRAFAIDHERSRDGRERGGRDREGGGHDGEAGHDREGGGHDRDGGHHRDDGRMPD